MHECSSEIIILFHLRLYISHILFNSKLFESSGYVLCRSASDPFLSYGIIQLSIQDNCNISPVTLYLSGDKYTRLPGTSRLSLLTCSGVYNNLTCNTLPVIAYLNVLLCLYFLSKVWSTPFFLSVVTLQLYL